jgi:hypothetical protein
MYVLLGDYKYVSIVLQSGGMTTMNEQVNITIQQSERFATLGVPREHLEALGEEIGQETVKQPEFNALVLAHKWGNHDIRMIVRNLGSGDYHIVFAMPEDVEPAKEDSE